MKGWNASQHLAGRIGPGTDWTHERVAEATGISQTTISNYAGGSKPLGMKNAQRIAAALGITVGDLGVPSEAVVTVASIDSRLEELQGAVAELLRAQAASADRAGRFDDAHLPMRYMDWADAPDARARLLRLGDSGGDVGSAAGRDQLLDVVDVDAAVG